MEVYFPADDGSFVSDKYERLARVVKEYDPWLELRYIPPAMRTRDDKKPYCVVDTRGGHAVLFASELDTPEQILARLFGADNAKGNVLDGLEAHNAAVEALRLREQMDEMEELAEQAYFMKQSPLHYVRFNGRMFDENRRVVGRARK